MSYVRTENGFAQSSSITPGYPNTIDGQMKFQSEYIKAPKDLIINEAMNSNYEYLPQMVAIIMIGLSYIIIAIKLLN